MLCLGFHFLSYHIFREVVGLERGPLSLVSKIEELLGRNSSGSGLEKREYDRGDSLRRPRDTFYPQKLALTSQTGCGRLIDILRSRTKGTDFELFVAMSVTAPGWMNGNIRSRPLSATGHAAMQIRRVCQRKVDKTLKDYWNQLAPSMLSQPWKCY
jgi:hypothetical protein